MKRLVVILALLVSPTQTAFSATVEPDAKTRDQTFTNAIEIADSLRANDGRYKTAPVYFDKRAALAQIATGGICEVYNTRGDVMQIYQPSMGPDGTTAKLNGAMSCKFSGVEGYLRCAVPSGVVKVLIDLGYNRAITNEVGVVGISALGQAHYSNEHYNLICVGLVTNMNQAKDQF